ncbi:attractin-like protein 1 [Centruroides vittatus]|uniref:attractin-like protein 1 n=1 Tax=Centruroides vittatus TaxID=120091 RepID=UPI003510C5DB
MVAHSGRVYLYFYSDAAYNMSGFNISYSINSCPKNCSDHGPCIDGICTCLAGWTGEACDISICCNGCEKEQHICICDPGYTGSDCSFKIENGWWEEVITNTVMQGRALHQSVVVKDSMWIIGGENFNHDIFQDIIMFNFTTNTWEIVEVTSNKPANRYGHSVIAFEDCLYMYGGMLYNGTVKNELWKFDIQNKFWSFLEKSKTNHQCSTKLCSPLAAVGHTATLVPDMLGDKIIIIFGHNPIYGYLNTVQEYDLTTGNWELTSTRGAIVKGGFGHTSVYDKRTERIYVYGGYHSFGSESALVDFLYAYNVWQREWKLLTPSHSHRYLHSAVIHHGLMLVFGGNIYNGTSHSSGDQCFSSDFLAYDLECDAWTTLEFPTDQQKNIVRFGHTAVLYNESMYVFGGFNGQMLNDIQRFSPGSCKQYHSADACEKSALGVKCVWNYEMSLCQLFSVIPYHVKAYRTSCYQRGANVTYLCGQQTLCPSCIANTYNCVWCGTSWCGKPWCGKPWCGTSYHHGKCNTGMKKIRTVDKCEEVESSNCDKLHNCHACHTEYHCGWQKDEKCYTFVREAGNGTEKAILSDDYRVKCELPCSSRTTCENCTKGPCMWCSNQRLCIESNAYAAVFAIAQCMEWTTTEWKCPGLLCKDIQTCDDCQKNPKCGWCDNGSGTGLGQCYDGSDLGPMTFNGLSYLLNNTLCPSTHWHFTSSPKCQCNGHSTCINDTDVCLQPCSNLTQGPYCQHCIAGYYGNPVNGGNCTPCFCNNHSHLCEQKTGKCHCNTKGMTGNHCERCDESNHYFGNPLEEGGSCYYNLSTDFKYTFNMSKNKDKHFTKINFMNVPVKPDADVELTIICSCSALINITVSSFSTTKRLLHEGEKCNNFKVQFFHDDYIFGTDNTTFYVRVFGFSTPFLLQISFSHFHRTFSQIIFRDLSQFFIIFSSCILSVLIIAAVLWKIKQKYDLYRRQRQFVEMEQMSSHPFADVSLETEKHAQFASDKNVLDGRKKLK